MANQILDRLLYGIGLDTSSFQGDASKIARQINFLGKEAKTTFERDFGRSLAKSIDPKNFQNDLNKARQIIQNFGQTAQATFNKTLGSTISKNFLTANQQAKGFFNTLIAGSSQLSRFHALLAGGIGGGLLIGKFVDLLAQAGKASIGFASSFQTSLAKVQTIADEGISIVTIRDELKELSQRVPQDLIGLTEGVFDIIGSGIKNTADALNVLEISAKAAVAGVSTTSEASRAIVFLLNAFQKDATEAAHISDILFETVDEGVVSFSDLAQQIGEVASPAALAGVSIEDLGAAFAVSTKAGISASETATGLKNAILSIVAPTEGASAAAERLGLDFSQAGIEAAGGFRQFLGLIKEATGGDIKKLEKIFPDKRALREIAILSGTMADEFQRLGEHMSDVDKVSGSTERAFAIMNATAENQYKLFKNNLNLAILEFGTNIIESALPALRALNLLLADVSPMEEFAQFLRQAGAPQADIDEADFFAKTDRIQKRIENLREEIDDLTDVDVTAMFGIDVSGKEFIEFIKNAEVLSHLQERLKKENEGITALFKQAADARRGDLTVNKESVEFELRAGKNRRDLLVKAIELRRSLIEQEKESQKLAGGKEQVAQQLLLDSSKEFYDVKRLTRAELEKIIELNSDGLTGEQKIVKEAREQLKLLDEQEKKREKALEFVDEVRKKLELLNAPTELDRKLILIRQEADERRKMFKGQEDAIKAVYALERAEILKTLAVRGGITAGTAIRGGKAPAIKLPVGLIPEVRIDKGFSKKLGEQIELNLRSIGAPIESFILDLEDLGINVDSLADAIGGSLGNLISNISNFSRALVSKDIVGTIVNGIALIRGIIGIGTHEESETERKRREEKEEAERRAAESVSRFTDELEELRRAIGELGVGDLELKLREVNDAVVQITRGSSQITEQAIQAFLGVIPVIQDLRRRIAAGIVGGVDVTDLINQLALLQGGLQNLGFGVESLTDTQIEALRLLLEQQQEVEDQLDQFGFFADNFIGLMKRLNLEFDLFNVDDPIKKLQRLQQSIQRQFGAIIPTTEEAIRNFISQGFAAIQAGGDALVNLLKSLDLEELTADQFAELLSLLNQFALEAQQQVDDIAGVGEEIGISAVKAITFQQGNRIQDELATIRIGVTHIDSMLSLGAIGAAFGAGITARNNFFIIREGGVVEKISETSLNNIDRRLVEKALAVSRAVGIS